MLDLTVLEKSFVSDTPLGRPSTAFFNLVRRCNAGCQYCLDWKNDPNPNTDLSINKIEEILISLHKIGVSEVVFSGGEPYLRSDIIEVLSLAKKMGFITRIITNGSAFTKGKIVETLKLGVKKIGISIDSIDSQKFKILRGLNLGLVKKNIETLVAEREKNYKDLDISLYVTISKLNIDDLLPLTDYAIEQKVKIQFQPVQFSGTGLEEYILEQLWPNEAEIVALEKIIYTLIDIQKVSPSIGSRSDFLAQIPTFFRKKTFYPLDRCYVAYADVVIDQDLGVRPCWPMEPIGNLSNAKLEDLWVSPKMRESREKIRMKECPGCLYSCHINKKHVTLPSFEID